MPGVWRDHDGMGRNIESAELAQRHTALAPAFRSPMPGLPSTRQHDEIRILSRLIADAVVGNDQ